MKQDEFKVVGIKHSTREGKESTTLFLETLFEDFETSNKDNSCEGVKTTSEYFFNNVKVNLGDIIEVLYKKNTFSGKAMAAGITIVTPAKK